MTVAELIAELRKLPPELPVCTSGEGGGLVTGVVRETAHGIDCVYIDFDEEQ